MLESGLLELKGARAETRYTSLATIKFIAGLQTQRSPFAPVDTRYGTRFLGGKPDALISGSNCEISNKLTVQRRPGLIAYSTASIPAPLFFYPWEQTSPPSLSLVVDTAATVYLYTPTSATAIMTKGGGSGQTSFYGLVDTLYMGDGVDLKKYTSAAGLQTWGIVAPTTAPTLQFAAVGSSWVKNTVYALNATITDSNGNLQTATTGGTSGATQPVWATTQGSTTTDNTVTWTEGGPNGLSPKTGYQYYYAFLNSTTGQPSNVSPISANTGALIGQKVTLTGARSTDAQVDKIAVYRNVDGGAFFYQLATLANPASGNWTFADTTQDSGLTTSIYAPIGLLNSPPPAGLVNLAFNAGRLWGSVGNLLYYAAGADNAALLNIVFNGVSAESWPAANVIAFDAPITRSVSLNIGLLVFTTNDIWIVTGSDLTTFAPLKLFAGHGLRSYNALDVDGSTIIAYLADRQLVGISPNLGVSEIGFPIGDQIEANIDPTKAYVARHVAGSQDNGIYLADGSTGWYRLNPNQVGASLGGEQTPVWSPFATISGGAGAVASVETSPGVHTLLVGGSGAGVVLARSLTAFTDNGTSYTWNAVIGSVILATAGMLAHVESLTVESTSVATPALAVLLDEISGTFETLSASVEDPPQLAASASLNSNRYYLSQGATPPLVRHMQIKLSGAAASTKDEVLSVMIRGVLEAEQT